MSLRADFTAQRGAFRLELSLAVEPGEVLALVGPNGAGKSTALAVIAGLLAPVAGTVTLDGVVLDDEHRSVPPERRNIGVVFQDYLLFPHLTALENVAFGLRARGMHRAEARQRALNWLARVDLEQYAGSKPPQLSGGQQQRVALARALVLEPALLLLDEPLSALDASIRTEVRADLARHLRQFGRATILVTHDPADAAALADRTFNLADSRSRSLL